MPSPFVYDDPDSVINASKQVSKVARMAVKKLGREKVESRDTGKVDAQYDVLSKLMLSINLQLKHTNSFFKRTSTEHTEIQLSTTLIGVVAKIQEASQILSVLDIDYLSKPKTVKLIALLEDFYQIIVVYQQNSQYVLFQNEPSLYTSLMEASNSLIQYARVLVHHEYVPIDISAEDYEEFEDEEEAKTEEEAIVAEITKSQQKLDAIAGKIHMLNNEKASNAEKMRTLKAQAEPSDITRMQHKLLNDKRNQLNKSLHELTIEYNRLNVAHQQMLNDPDQTGRGLPMKRFL